MKSWVRSNWKVIVIGFALFFLGTLIGTAGSDTDGTAERVTVSETESETMTETVDPTEEEEAALDRRAERLDARERELDQRARKIARQERVAARSRFSDGVYLVGKDIPAGSYVAPGSPAGDCYWERSTRGGDIIDNHIGAGQVRATVNAGELFSTQSCGTWKRG